jgi:hypothetical protein
MAYKSWSPAAWTGIAIEKHLIVALKVKANESNSSVVALGRIADESFFPGRTADESCFPGPLTATVSDHGFFVDYWSPPAIHQLVEHLAGPRRYILEERQI